MINCPAVESLPAVIEHRKTCPCCRANEAEPGTVEWWALELCRAFHMPLLIPELRYLLSDGTTRIWIITEADRSATTILLPDEY